MTLPLRKPSFAACRGFQCAVAEIGIACTGSHLPRVLSFGKWPEIRLNRGNLEDCLTLRVAEACGTLWTCFQTRSRMPGLCPQSTQPLGDPGPRDLQPAWHQALLLLGTLLLQSSKGGGFLSVSSTFEILEAQMVHFSGLRRPRAAGNKVSTGQGKRSQCSEREVRRCFQLIDCPVPSERSKKCGE